MPDPEVVPAVGSEILMASPGETPSYVKIGNLLSVGMASAEVGEVATSNLGSGQVLTFRPGRTDPGEVAFSIQFLPDDVQHAALRALVYAPVPKLFRITTPTTPVMGEDFGGYVKSCSPAVEGEDGNWEADVVIRVSGATTPYTAGS